MTGPDFQHNAPPHVGPRPVFVGEVNPYNDRPWTALLDVPAGASGDRLRRLVCAIGVRRYRAFPRYDLCVGKWSAPAARVRAKELAREHIDDVLVLLGRKVATVFDVGGIPSFTLTRLDVFLPRTFVLLPHPSGLCREWHAPGAFDRARALLAEAMPLVPWGESLRPPLIPRDGSITIDGIEVGGLTKRCSNCGLVKAANVCPECGDDQGATS